MSFELSIDGTHTTIPIRNPGGSNAQRYINRKGFYSLNIQVCCDCTSLIWSVPVVARWPGSAHDARMFHESKLKQRSEDGTIPGIFLGDRGYPSLHYLLIPLLSPQTQSERRVGTTEHTKQPEEWLNELSEIWKKIPMPSFSTENFSAEHIICHHNGCLCSPLDRNITSRSGLHRRTSSWRGAGWTGRPTRPTERHRIPQELYRDEFLKVRIFWLDIFSDNANI